MTSNQPIAIARGIAGALVGAVVGYLIYDWALGKGILALGILGLLVGWGASLASRRRSVPMAIIAGVIGLVAAFWGHTQNFHFTDVSIPPEDQGMLYQVKRLGDMSGVTHIHLVASALLAAWMGLGRDSGHTPGASVETGAQSQDRAASQQRANDDS